MWLQLTRGPALLLPVATTCALVLACPAAASGEDLGARVDVYTDGDLTVVNQSGAARVETPEGWSAQGHYAIDAISGATRSLTVDAVSSATRFTETRLEGGVGIGMVPLADTRVRAEYMTSHEPDYDTHAARGTLALDVLQRQATATASLGLSTEDVGSVQDREFHERSWGLTIDLRWAHVLTKRTQLTALAWASANTCGQQIGCFASPYRFAPVRVVDEGTEVVVALRERHPSSRLRGAGGLRLSQSLSSLSAPNSLALHAGYRLYADTWGVVGHTADAALALGLFAERVVVRGEARAATQSSASFRRAVYDGTPSSVPAVRTADRELGALDDVLAGGRLLFSVPVGGPLTSLDLSLRVAHVWYVYKLAEIDARAAWIAGGGLVARFP